MSRSFWVETLGCPKNQVDSEKLTGALLTDGMVVAHSAEDADLVVVNTCAFIEDAREESVATILALDEARSEQSRLVVTGCMAERYGDELATALPEVDQVVGFGIPVTIGRRPAPSTATSSATPTATATTATATVAEPPAMDLLNMARPASTLPWAYVKVAEGCDKACGFCAIPSFRGPQRSRTVESILDEVEQLDVHEVVLIAQDLAAYGRDQGVGQKSIVKLVEAVAERADWVRLLYLYPSELSEGLIELIASGPVPYFDLSLQHVSAPLVRRMRRWGNGDRYMERIQRIRQMRPDATFRSNFIVGYPGETESDHDELLDFVNAAQLDWCGFFSYSQEAGTYAADLDGQVDPALMADRLAELRELQDGITARRRDALIGTRATVLVDSPGVARSQREAPEIDGIISVPRDLQVGRFHEVEITDALGPDLTAEPLRPTADGATSEGPATSTTTAALNGRGESIERW